MQGDDKQSPGRRPKLAASLVPLDLVPPSMMTTNESGLSSYRSKLNCHTRTWPSRACRSADPLRGEVSEDVIFGRLVRLLYAHAKAKNQWLVWTNFEDDMISDAVEVLSGAGHNRILHGVGCTHWRLHFADNTYYEILG